MIKKMSFLSLFFFQKVISSPLGLFVVLPLVLPPVLVAATYYKLNSTTSWSCWMAFFWLIWPLLASFRRPVRRVGADSLWWFMSLMATSELISFSNGSLWFGGRVRFAFRPWSLIARPAIAAANRRSHFTCWRKMHRIFKGAFVNFSFFTRC